MGIVNITPDSFSDGGRYGDADSAVRHALDLVEQGADIIDLGAQSTRPGYSEVSQKEEWRRVEPVLSALCGKIDVPISVDTYFPSVAAKSVDNGADIINDVSGVIHPDMADIVSSSGCGWVVMHNGSGGVQQVGDFFRSAVHQCEQFGVRADQICLDMGIGFGKTADQGAQLISNIKSYRLDGYPLLMGCSRKRVIGEISGQACASERIYGNIAADTVAILCGVDIIRLHDVKNEKQGISAAQELAKWIR